MAGVFPTPQRVAIAYDFRDVYREAVAKLPRGPLLGGDLPSGAEIADAADEIAEIEDRRRKENEGGGKTLKQVTTKPALGPAPKPTPAPPKGGGPGPVGPAPVKHGSGGVMDMSEGMGGVPVGIAGGGPVATGSGSGDPSRDPTARARIAKAHNIRCYVGTDPAAPGFSFHVSPLYDSPGEPRPDDMWYAQVGLWVQEDVVAAIAALNEEAAKQLKPEDDYVENMPVKRLQSVRVAGYYTDSGAVQFPTYGRGGAGAPTYSGDSFTGRASDKNFDVVRFTVVAVVDQRDATRLIDAITRQNVYQLIDAKYEALTAAAPDSREGYFYGANPVVRVTLDFEGYLARSVYAKWFPPEVRVALGLTDEKGKGGKTTPKPKGKP